MALFKHRSVPTCVWAMVLAKLKAELTTLSLTIINTTRSQTTSFTTCTQKCPYIYDSGYLTKQYTVCKEAVCVCVCVQSSGFN